MGSAVLEEDVELHALDRGRFIAGTVLSGRYRIIGRLGRGGMGEVYKAEDLTLHQLVALKFLPSALSNDGAMLARLHREVRAARHVTHSNVCRVHDIGEALIDGDSVHFLSMEYIDGEDLAALLRRIGHLPHEKSIELARQLCAGLAAAHEAGMIHRDLKPANIMLDGRGRARIMDFGLSEFADELRTGEASGTPAYMAPEQLRSQPATIASDIYALGLVLYEVFTGHRPFDSDDIRDLLSEQERTIRPPSSRVGAINPLVERVILRCLAAKPDERPRSAIDVAAVLPGGDPLAAALAAGETPSPEMVAAAGEKTGLRPLIAWMCLIAVLLASIAVAVPLNPAKAWHRKLGESPEVLINMSRRILADLGYAVPEGSVSGFSLDEDYIDYAHRGRNAKGFQAYLSESRPGWARFSYQPDEPASGSRRLVPLFARLGANVRDTNHVIVPQTPRIVLDADGWLTEFHTVKISPTAATADWSVFFNAAGIDEARLKPVAPRASPPVPFDSQVSWQGTWANRPDVPMIVEGALSHGTPVFFQASGPWLAQSAPPKQEAKKRAFTAINVGVVVFILALVTTIPLARHNMRAGRGDQRGAYRVGLFTLSVLLLSWVFGSDHQMDARELNLLVAAIGEALFRSVVVGLLYLAIEPLIRQRWPHALIPWNRVLEGNFRDPVVGRSALVGLVLASTNALLRNGLLISDEMSPVIAEPDLLNAMVSNSYSVSFLLALISDSVSIPLGLFALFSTFRIAFRSQWIAGIALTVIIESYVNLQHQTFEISGLMVGASFSLLWLVGVMRFGLIAGMSMWFADRVFRALSMLAPAAWYSVRLYFFVAAVLALSFYAFANALGKQPLLPMELVGESSESENKV
jgi:serine/threonine-protein kinase